jgi:uncharacterized protein (DUF1697 family)
MPRYVAFLRGVSPLNLKMPDLKRCVEEAGFTGVKTIISSGNVAFDASARSGSAIERQIEAALKEQIGRSFLTIIRSRTDLNRLIENDPFDEFELPADAKRMVTFSRNRNGTCSLPITKDGARILKATNREIFSAYVPNPRGAVFMQVIESACGKEVTTRTWETVKKCARA